MEISSQRGKELRVKIGRIATTVAFAVVMCGVTAGPVCAADQHGHDNRGGGQHHDDHGRGRHRPEVRSAPQPDYYYAPGPNYYSAPEPQYYYPAQPDYEPPPSQGINLFFGF